MEYIKFENGTIINFDLDKNTIVIGENGVGKTRALKFINSASSGIISNLDKYGIEDTSLIQDEVIEENSILYYKIKESHAEILDLLLRFDLGRINSNEYTRLLASSISLLDFIKTEKRNFFEMNSTHQSMYLYEKLPKKASKKEINKGIEFYYKNYIYSLMDMIDTRIKYNELIDPDSHYEILSTLRKNNIKLRNVKSKKKFVNLAVNEMFNSYFLGTDRINSKYIKYFFEQEFEDISGKKKIEEKLFDTETTSDVAYDLSIIIQNIKVFNKYMCILGSKLELSLSKGKFLILKNDKIIDITVLSSGEKSIVIMLLTLVFTRDTIILIDEIELAFTFDWQIKILNVIEELSEVTNNNVLITTHSALVYNQAENNGFYNIEVCS